MRAGDVADGQHVRVRRAQVGVDDDAVLHVQPGGLGEVDAGRGPDPDDDQVGVDQRAVGQLDRTHVRPVARGDDLGDLGRASAGRPRSPGAGPRTSRASSGPRTREQRQRVAHQHAHLAAGRAGGGGDLEADPPAADDHDARCRPSAARAGGRCRRGCAGGRRRRGRRRARRAGAAPSRSRARGGPSRSASRSRRRRRVRPGRSTGPSSPSRRSTSWAAYQSAGCTNAPSRSSLPCR